MLKIWFLMLLKTNVDSLCFQVGSLCNYFQSPKEALDILKLILEISNSHIRNFNRNNYLRARTSNLAYASEHKG